MFYVINCQHEIQDPCPEAFFHVITATKFYVNCGLVSVDIPWPEVCYVINDNFFGVSIVNVLRTVDPQALGQPCGRDSWPILGGVDKG